MAGGGPHTAPLPSPGRGGVRGPPSSSSKGHGTTTGPPARARAVRVSRDDSTARQSPPPQAARANLDPNGPSPFSVGSPTRRQRLLLHIRRCVPAGVRTASPTCPSGRGPGGGSPVCIHCCRCPACTGASDRHTHQALWLPPRRRGERQYGRTRKKRKKEMEPDLVSVQAGKTHRREKKHIPRDKTSNPKNKRET